MTRHLMTTAMLAGLATIAAAAPSLPPSEPAYTVTDLGELPPIAGDVFPSINDKGHVALWKREGRTVVPMLWADGKTTDLKTLPGYVSAVARAIAPDDTVAGWTSTSGNMVDSSATVHPVVFKNGVAIDLGTLGGPDAQAYGIAPNGDVVGVSMLADRRTRHAFLWHAGVMRDLGALPDGTFSAAYAINAGGVIVGLADSGGQNHAVCWRNSKIEDLGTLPGQPRSAATAVNENGVVTGFGETGDGVHAIRIADHGPEDLGVLKSDPSSARAINSAGEIVGTAQVSTYTMHAFRWRDGKLVDLNTLIAPDAGWVLHEADSINDRGQILCVGGRRYQSPHCLLLTPLLSDNRK